MRFEELIFMEAYYLTSFDYWLLLQKHKIPAFFISSKSLMETNYEKNVFVAYGNSGEDKFIFIVIPGLRFSNSPSYKWIQTITGEAADGKKMFFSFNELKNTEILVNALNEKISIGDYLSKFVKPKAAAKPQKKQTRELEIEE